MTSVDFGNISLFTRFNTFFFTTEDVIVEICSRVYDLNSFIFSSTLHYVQLLLKLWQNLLKTQFYILYYLLRTWSWQIYIDRK